MARKARNIVLLTDNEKILVYVGVCDMCDLVSGQTLGLFFTKFCTQVLGRKTSAEFVNGPIRLNRFKIAAIRPVSI